MNCTLCNVPLSGRLDTYGPVGDELCWACYSEHILGEYEAQMELLNELNTKLGANCKRCGALLKFGALLDDGVERTCPACGYHDSLHVMMATITKSAAAARSAER